MSEPAVDWDGLRRARRFRSLFPTREERRGLGMLAGRCVGHPAPGQVSVADADHCYYIHNRWIAFAHQPGSASTDTATVDADCTPPRVGDILLAWAVEGGAFQVLRLLAERPDWPALLKDGPVETRARDW